MDRNPVVRNLQLAEAVMWIMTKVGFFSVVQKAEDVEENALTIRARVRADLVALKREYLPEMGPITEDLQADYRFRTRAWKTDWVSAMGKIAQGVDYENFKDEVKRLQGPTRAGLYGKVWQVLFDLKTERRNSFLPFRQTLSSSAHSGRRRSH